MVIPAVRDATPRRLLAFVAVLNAAVLILTASHQIYDTNFYTLWEATAIRAGDHPYRDFFEWGAPLQALVSLAAQVAAGNRLVGEFAVQWLGIICGAVISFHVGLRACRSIAASLVMSVLALTIVAATATYHYPKLLFYPLAIWVMWRYMDSPGTGRAAVVGLVTAAAFLFRHDYGVYIAGVAVAAFVLARLVTPSSRSLRAWCAESAFAAAATLVVLTPWAILVQTTEGLPEYVEARSQRYAVGSPYSNPFASLLTLNPVRTLSPEKAPPPAPGVVSFEWEGHVAEDERKRIVAEYGLRLVQGPDARGRWQYEVENRFDPRLLGLGGSVNDVSGLDLSRLSELRWPLPARTDAVMWLQQVALLVPLLLLTSAGLAVLRSRRRREPVPGDTYHVIVAAALLAVVDWRLFREPGYVAAVAPITAALAARLLVGPHVDHRRATENGIAWGRRLGAAARTAVALGMLFVTAAATFVYARGSDIFAPWRLAPGVADAFSELMASPAIDGFAPREEVLALDHTRWNEQDVNAVRVLMRYLHDCTAPGDRVLVTGQTPFQVGYYVERPIAGGHLFWHEGWRSDAAREQQSLTLLEHQSVPFAYSTHDPVFDDFRRYPRIREYLLKHYKELEGSRGLVLVDTRRQPTGTFGALGFPCFR